MTVDLSQFLPTFFEESFEGVEVMESNLLSLTSDDRETIDSIFRAAHSIKGGAGTFGLERVSEFTHLVETLLDELRDGRRQFNEQDKELLLRATDTIKALLECEKNGVAIEQATVDEVTTQLNNALNGRVSLVSNESSGWRIIFIPEPDIAQTGNDPLLLFQALADLGTVHATCNDEHLPDFDTLDVEELHLSWQLTLTDTQASQLDIEEIFEWVEDECTLEIAPLSEPQSQTQVNQAQSSGQLPNASEQQVSNLAPSSEVTITGTPEVIESKEPKPSRGKHTDAGSIRVGVDKVDSLINLVGELVITQSMLSELGQDITSADSEKLKAGLEQLMQNTKELQESVMRIRMLPISFTFNRFPRLVHDLAKKIGKEINLVIQGEHTELDKTVLERIGDPLTHLVRNAIDHGIEAPDVRTTAGKPPEGQITLSAYHLGGNVVIEIADDGKGIDTELILAKAKEKQLIDGNYPLNIQQIYDLIFEPGFSTAACVSDISGRGVGMDVVKRNIQALGGRIVIDSALGKGSNIKVYLPLTLAILDGQLVKVCGQTYIIPLLIIVESVQMQADNIVTASGGQYYYRLRDDNVPILPLGKLFNLGSQASPSAEGLLVVTECEGQKVGLLVDDLLGQQQVVIKSLQENYQQVNGISGATILGNGAVALIIDIAGIIDLSKKHTNGVSKQTSAQEVEQ
ncbi:chemotaxis protein CheA [Thalassotalea sp. LPB0316]|uniref:chemotaxis protein CheA n=1 Tax=Thalassotalea sp. LPB0316 TaxID=2769490 RepID=UPI0018679A94|nr:chemotaxis protein CheA [Thalassotalea sp. LPB0316]QOL24771.1 chemotaxis protein CheA [Thalassotalea sp. LPB0316]